MPQLSKQTFRFGALIGPLALTMACGLEHTVFHSLDGSVDDGGVDDSSVGAGARCGNGIREAGERCDDGNTLSHDGCHATCKVEQGWRCSETQRRSTCTRGCVPGEIDRWGAGPSSVHIPAGCGVVAAQAWGAAGGSGGAIPPPLGGPLFGGRGGGGAYVLGSFVMATPTTLELFVGEGGRGGAIFGSCGSGGGGGGATAIVGPQGPLLIAGGGGGGSSGGGGGSHTGGPATGLGTNESRPGGHGLCNLPDGQCTAGPRVARGGNGGFAAGGNAVVYGGGGGAPGGAGGVAISSACGSFGDRSGKGGTSYVHPEATVRFFRQGAGANPGNANRALGAGSGSLGTLNAATNGRDGRIIVSWGARRECGDGIAEHPSLEQCDVGPTPSPACTEACTLEPGWVCRFSPSECVHTCGNARIDPGETCDFGDINSGDGCSPNCQVEDGWLCDRTHCMSTCGFISTFAMETHHIVPPPACQRVRVELVGGGGGAGYSRDLRGGSGGGGAYVATTITLPDQARLRLVVGGGGPGGVGPTEHGAGGGASFFQVDGITFAVAGGGGGGRANGDGNGLPGRATGEGPVRRGLSGAPILGMGGEAAEGSGGSGGAETATSAGGGGGAPGGLASVPNAEGGNSYALTQDSVVLPGDGPQPGNDLGAGTPGTGGQQSCFSCPGAQGNDGWARLTWLP